ncbi:MAG TPA: hypothetical protein VGF99_15710 [Myxococcota bacterium]
MRATSPRLGASAFVFAVLATLSSTSLLAAPRVFVTPVVGAADDATRQGLSRALETEITAAVPDHEVMSSATIATGIEMAQLRNCISDEETESCFAELSDALDADFVVRGDLVRLTDVDVFSISIIEGRTGRLLGQQQYRGRHGDDAALLGALPRLARGVAVDAGLRAPPPPPPSPVPGFVAAGVGVLVAGGGVGVLLWRNELIGRYLDGRQTKDEANLVEQGGDGLLGLGIGAIVVGGAALVAGTAVGIAALVAHEE